MKPKNETLAAMIRRIINETELARADYDTLGSFAFDAAAVAEEGGEEIPNSRNLSNCLAEMDGYRLDALREEDPAKLRAASALAMRCLEMIEASWPRVRAARMEGGAK
jgi:hypothetical protein